MENIYNSMFLTPRNTTGGSKLLFLSMRTRDEVDYLDASDAIRFGVVRMCAYECLRFAVLRMSMYESDDGRKYGTVKVECEGEDRRVGDRASYHFPSQAKS